eukprot:gene2939-3126_t
MAEFLDARKQAHHQPQQQQQSHQISSNDKKDLFKTVPDVVEERKKDQDGIYHVVNKYIKGNILGKGGFAQVYLSTSLANKEKYALKIVAKSSLTKPRARLKLQTEIKIHRALCHSNIVRFERFFEDNEYAYLVLELCGNNSMSDLLNQRKRITELETKYYLYQLVNSLQYLHRHLVIHRDLKLGNLFIDENMKLKVGDFGLAAKLQNETERRMTVCGTPNYIAPELLEGKKGHSFEVDIWSTGVVMYTLLVGKPPYQSKDVKSTYKRILANSYSYPENITISNEARTLISRMLELKPEARATLQEILDHPFLNPAQVPSSLPVSAMKENPSFHVKTTLMTMQQVEKGLSYQNPGKVMMDYEHPAKQLPKVFNNENDPNAHNRLFQHNIVEEMMQKPAPPSITNPSILAPSVPAPAPTSARASTPAPTLSHRSPPGDSVLQKANKSSSSIQNMAKVSTVEKIHKMLDKSYSSTNVTTALSSGVVTSSRNNVWVVRYIDYTSKYGLGFLFNNGSAGVYFNDSTKIVLSSDGRYFQYIERRRESTSSANGMPSITSSEHQSQKFYIDNYPPELQKKVTLLKHFRNYLLEEEAKNPHNMNHEQTANDLQALKTAFSKEYHSDKNNYNSRYPSSSSSSSQEIEEETDLAFLKKWVKTKHAILFRISNRTVQVIFYDRSEVLLSSEAQIITYVNKTGERSEHALNDIMLAGRVDIAKRLKYTKDIMHRLIQSQQGK